MQRYLVIIALISLPSCANVGNDQQLRGDAQEDIAIALIYDDNNSDELRQCMRNLIRNANKNQTEMWVNMKDKLKKPIILIYCSCLEEESPFLYEHYKRRSGFPQSMDQYVKAQDAHRRNDAEIGSCLGKKIDSYDYRAIQIVNQ